MEAIVGQRGDLGGVSAADGAVDIDGIIILPLALGGVLGAVAVNDIKDLAALLQGFDDVLTVFPAAVHFRLMTEVHVDAELADGGFEFPLEMNGVVLRIAVGEGVGHVHVGATDVRLHVVADLCHVDGHLTHPVKFVPGEEQTGFLAHSAQGTHHEIAGRHVAEVADMDGARGRNSRGADVFFLVGVTVDDLLCDFFGPMHDSVSFYVSWGRS